MGDLPVEFGLNAEQLISLVLIFVVPRGQRRDPGPDGDQEAKKLASSQHHGAQPPKINKVKGSSWLRVVIVWTL